jgi:hypothetical protein
MNTRVCSLATVAALLGWTLLGLTGCQSAGPTGDPTPGPAAEGKPVPTNDLDLLEYIGDQPFVTAESGYRATYVLWKGEDFTGDYAALRAELENAGLVPQVWQHAADRPLTRADVGFLICRACGIRTGVLWNVLPLGRYGYRELIYHEIARPGGDYALVSGGEFQGILRRAERYLAQSGHSLAPTPDLGPPQ